jgi:outer membrane protein assembly factor BamB
LDARANSTEARILQSIALSGGIGHLVLFDWSGKDDYRLNNLVGRDPDGKLMWTAELPENTGPDCFTGADIAGNAIRAHTWSCFALTLDPRTGKTLATCFTK